jgi:ferredoxin-NADP reductase
MITHYDAYICGSPDMAAATAGRLEQVGLPREQVFTEDFGGSGE